MAEIPLKLVHRRVTKQTKAGSGNTKPLLGTFSYFIICWFYSKFAKYIKCGTPSYIYIYLSICLSICLCIYMSICLIYLPTYLSVYTHVVDRYIDKYIKTNAGFLCLSTYLFIF